MREEMIKLNRIKYATSEEEKQKLIREGYVPVYMDQAAEEPGNDSKTADPAAGAEEPGNDSKTADPAAGAEEPGDDSKTIDPAEEPADDSTKKRTVKK